MNIWLFCRDTLGTAVGRSTFYGISQKDTPSWKLTRIGKVEGKIVRYGGAYSILASQRPSAMASTPIAILLKV